MNKKAGYKGRAPDEIYVVSTGDEFRTYIYQKQALRWLDGQVLEGNSPQMFTYIRQDQYEGKGI